MKFFYLFVCSILLGTVSGQDGAKGKKPSPLTSLVRVNMTSQAIHFYQPWEKMKPSTRRGLGAVLKGNKVITGAKFVADATYLELEHPVTGRKIPAKVDAVDYEANLAILTPLGPMFDDRVPLEIDTNVSPGDSVTTWQVESNGTPFALPGKVVRAKIGSTFLERNYFLVYEIGGVMQFRGGSVIVPAVRNNKLIGLLVSYNSKEQVSEVISGPVIAHFLKDVAEGKYEGFPQFGVTVSQTLDDQFRKYLKLPPTGGGIYVSAVKEGLSAASSGIKKGDVLLSISGHEIDARGYYTDAKYGKLSYLNLVQSQPHVGDEIDTVVLRDGEKKQIKVKLTRHESTQSLIEPYVFDRGPRYMVLGGLIFQELTRNYLKLYGSDWRSRAPFKLTYADTYPKKYEDKGIEKLVFLSRVIPTKTNVGYEKLSSLLVTKVNDREIKSIKDLDTAIANPIDGFHKIEFDEFPSVIFLDAAEAEKTNAELQKDYGIHSLKQLD